MEFSFNQLSQEIYSALKDLGFTEATEIQKITIPLLLEKDLDLVGQAQTGTGKTAAFCLPLLEKLDFSKKNVQAIILSPTRELANQINQEILKFGANTPLRTATVYGGVGYKEQIQNIQKAHVVVATPGRAIDLINRRKLILDHCEYFVIDEADEMLKMGFIADVDLLLGQLKSSAKKWMFSATMPKEIIRLMESKMNSPALIRMKKSTLSNKNITQNYAYLQKKDFYKALKMILLTEESFYGIVFCQTKEDVKRISERLTSQGQRAVALHGDLNQNQRDAAMEKFKNKKVNILVCTDVASRGVDVTEVSHVINMGLPRKPDSYVHRIGRTGRAGQVGKAISFVPPQNFRELQTIEKLINDKLDLFPLPKAVDSKNIKINSEIERMTKLKKALLEMKNDFNLDQSFDLFNDFLEELSREEIIKLMFSYQFNKDLKEIDDVVLQYKNSVLMSKGNSQTNSRGVGNKSLRGKSRFRKRNY